MPEKSYPAVFKFRGGHDALDFCNTVHWRRRPVYTELLTGYGRLIDWARQAGVLTRAEAVALRRRATREPARAEAARRVAIATRDALHRLLAAQAGGRPPKPADDRCVGQALARAGAHAELRRQGNTYTRRVPAGSFHVVLWRVLLAVVPLLTGPELERVGQCQDPRGCGWLFLDTTKNHSRRWCAMEDCGSLDKARRYYQRKTARSRTTAG